MENIPNGESPAESYRRRLYELSNQIDDALIVSYFDDINTKSQEWKKEYGEKIAQYELYHVLIGSTPVDGQTFVAFDFPENSVAAFIGELEKKYLKV